VLERDVEERGPSLRQDVVAITQFRVQVYPASAAFRDPRGDGQRAVDEHGLSVAHEHARRHSRKAVPRRKETARLVEGGPDEASVDESRACLVSLAE
jgi:hypothetical protein